VSTYHVANGRRNYIQGLFPHCSGTNLDSCGPFSLPQLGKEGNERINQFRNPGFAQVDATFKKVTSITERGETGFAHRLFQHFQSSEPYGCEC
jgi:hypothetical protein